MPRRRLARIAIVMLLAVLAAAVLWRIKRHVVPAGAEARPFLFGSTDPESIVSPNGRKVLYRFEERAEEESGFRYTWCYTDHWLTGKEVVAAGFSQPDVSSGAEEFPWYWHGDGKDFSVRFTGGPGDETIRWFSGRLE